METHRFCRELLWLTLLILGAAISASPALAEELEDFLLDLAIVPLDGRAPEGFTLDSLDGRRVSLSDYRGKVAVLYFWMTT